MFLWFYFTYLLLLNAFEIQIKIVQTIHSYHMKLCLHFLLSILFGAWNVFSTKENSLVFLCNLFHPKTVKQIYLGQIFIKLLRYFTNVVMDLILNFLSLQNRNFKQGTGPFPKKSPLCLSKHRIQCASGNPAPNRLVSFTSST